MKINVNHVNINYEIYGSGAPILLLHGNGENLSIFDKLTKKLKENHTVYALDSRCHGNSERTKTISYDLMAEDTIAFIKKLKIHKPVLYGFSDGGIIGLIVAIKEPDLLSKLIISGANINPDGIKKMIQMIWKIRYWMTKSPSVKMMVCEPNISLKDLRKISIPVHVIAGEKDFVKREHTNLIAEHLKNSTLEIVPKASHGSYIIHSEKIYETLNKYLS